MLGPFWHSPMFPGPGSREHLQKGHSHVGGHAGPLEKGIWERDASALQVVSFSNNASILFWQAWLPMCLESERESFPSFGVHVSLIQDRIAFARTQSV